MDVLRLDVEAFVLLLEARVVFDDLRRHRDDVASFPELQDAERLQRPDDVLALDGGEVADVLHGDAAAVILQQLDQHMRPIRAERKQSQIGERLFGRPDFSLQLRQLVREGDEQLSVSFPLIRRQRHNAREMVIVRRVLLFREVADEMAAALIAFAEDVKQKWLDVVIQRFVVEEEFRYQAQILTVYFAFLSID